MRLSRFRLAVVFLALECAAYTFCSNGEETRQTESESPTSPTYPSGSDRSLADVEALVNYGLDCWNANKIDELMDSFWHSPDLLCVLESKTCKGWSEARQRFMEIQPDRTGITKSTIQDLNLRLIRPGVVTGSISYLIQRPTEKIHALATGVIRQFPDGWHIVSCFIDFY
jgi:hypothetical protein